MWSKFIYLARRRPANAPSSVDVSGETKTAREEEDGCCGHFHEYVRIGNVSECAPCNSTHGPRHGCMHEFDLSGDGEVQGVLEWICALGAYVDGSEVVVDAKFSLRLINKITTKWNFGL